MGAFVLAAAGLLDGRRATTHWRYAAALARRYPRVEVDPSVLYVDGGQVLTSAGVAAGVDLCLHMVRRDHGSAVAARTARRIVMPPQQLLESTDLPVERVAAEAGFGSAVTLRAHFARRVGASPLAYRSAFRTRTPPG